MTKTQKTNSTARKSSKDIEVIGTFQKEKISPAMMRFFYTSSTITVVCAIWFIVITFLKN